MASKTDAELLKEYLTDDEQTFMGYAWRQTTFDLELMRKSVLELTKRLIRKLHEAKEENALLKAEFTEEIKQHKLAISFHFKVKDERDKFQSQNKIMLETLIEIGRPRNISAYILRIAREAVNEINKEQSK